MGEPGFKKIVLYWYCIGIVLYCSTRALVLYCYYIACYRLALFILVKKIFKNSFIKSTLSTDMFANGKERYRVTVTGVIQGMIYGVSLEPL